MAKNIVWLPSNQDLTRNYGSHPLNIDYGSEIYISSPGSSLRNSPYSLDLSENTNGDCWLSMWAPTSDSITRSINFLLDEWELSFDYYLDVYPDKSSDGANSESAAPVVLFWSDLLSNSYRKEIPIGSTAANSTGLSIGTYQDTSTINLGYNAKLFTFNRLVDYTTTSVTFGTAKEGAYFEYPTADVNAYPIGTTLTSPKVFGYGCYEPKKWHNLKLRRRQLTLEDVAMMSQNDQNPYRAGWCTANTTNYNENSKEPTNNLKILHYGNPPYDYANEISTYPIEAFAYIEIVIDDEVQCRGYTNSYRSAMYRSNNFTIGTFRDSSLSTKTFYKFRGRIDNYKIKKTGRFNMSYDTLYNYTRIPWNMSSVLGTYNTNDPTSGAWGDFLGSSTSQNSSYGAPLKVNRKEISIDSIKERATNVGLVIHGDGYRYKTLEGSNYSGGESIIDSSNNLVAQFKSYVVSDTNANNLGIYGNLPVYPRNIMGQIPKYGLVLRDYPDSLNDNRFNLRPFRLYNAYRLTFKNHLKGWGINKIGQPFRQTSPSYNSELTTWPAFERIRKAESHMLDTLDWSTGFTLEGWSAAAKCTVSSGGIVQTPQKMYLPRMAHIADVKEDPSTLTGTPPNTEGQFVIGIANANYSSSITSDYVPVGGIISSFKLYLKFDHVLNSAFTNLNRWIEWWPSDITGTYATPGNFSSAAIGKKWFHYALTGELRKDGKYYINLFINGIKQSASRISTTTDSYGMSFSIVNGEVVLSGGYLDSDGLLFPNVKKMINSWGDVSDVPNWYLDTRTSSEIADGYPQTFKSLFPAYLCCFGTGSLSDYGFDVATESGTSGTNIDMATMEHRFTPSHAVYKNNFTPSKFEHHNTYASIEKWDKSMYQPKRNITSKRFDTYLWMGPNEWGWDNNATGKGRFGIASRNAKLWDEINNFDTRPYISPTYANNGDVTSSSFYLRTGAGPQHNHYSNLVSQVSSETPIRIAKNTTEFVAPLKENSGNVIWLPFEPSIQSFGSHKTFTITKGSDNLFSTSGANSRLSMDLSQNGSDSWLKMNDTYPNIQSSINLIYDSWELSFDYYINNEMGMIFTPIDTTWWMPALTHWNTSTSSTDSTKIGVGTTLSIYLTMHSSVSLLGHRVFFITGLAGAGSNPPQGRFFEYPDLAGSPTSYPTTQNAILALDADIYKEKKWHSFKLVKRKLRLEDVIVMSQNDHPLRAGWVTDAYGTTNSKLPTPFLRIYGADAIGASGDTPRLVSALPIDQFFYIELIIDGKTQCRGYTNSLGTTLEQTINFVIGSSLGGNPGSGTGTQYFDGKIDNYKLKKINGQASAGQALKISTNQITSNVKIVENY